jgi:hypothetical protein
MRFPRLGIALGFIALLALGVPATGGSVQSGDAGAGAGSTVPADYAQLAGLKATGLKPQPRFVPNAFLIARPRGSSLELRSAPGGAVVVRIGATTEFGSPLRLGVVKQRGNWFGVVSTRLPNGRLGWVRAKEVRLSTTDISLTLDLSQRRLVLKRGDRVLRRMVVGVGRPSSPTPRGRFAVTDKLSGYRYSPAYGCCIVALSAHQPNLPAGWTGGDRIAIHGTNDPASIGVASSAGCPHASYADMQALMRRVPLGAPVFIRA